MFDSRVPLDAGSTDTGGRNGTVPPEAAGADTYLVAHFNASDAIDGVQLFSKGSVVFLNEQCTQVLVYADQVCVRPASHVSPGLALNGAVV